MSRCTVDGLALNWGCEPQDEAYLGLAHGYLADQRFVDYYDKPCGTGATAFLVQAIESSLVARIDRGGFGYFNQNLQPIGDLWLLITSSRYSL